MGSGLKLVDREISSTQGPFNLIVQIWQTDFEPVRGTLSVYIFDLDFKPYFLIFIHNCFPGKPGIGTFDHKRLEVGR